MEETKNVVEFVEFQKIARLKREVIVSEKIDGTNAVIHIDGDGQLRVGSRTRWITPEDDNFGFARWVKEHEEELRGLGIGRHYGEWWGSGIQRGYGLSKGEKRFSLFNVIRWSERCAAPDNLQPVRPACCHVVPVLYRGIFDTAAVTQWVDVLREGGSQAAPGFMKPEGVVVYHTQGRVLFKRTIEKDEEPKGYKKAA